MKGREDWNAGADDSRRNFEAHDTCTRHGYEQRIPINDQPFEGHSL